MSNGGSAITGYTATASPGGATCTTTGGLGCTVGGLSSLTTYSFTITATNGVGTGPASNALSATPIATGTVSSAPQNLKVLPNDPSGIILTWTPPNTTGGSPITGYRIYRGTASHLETLLTSVSGTTTFTDRAVANGTTYFYQVTAMNGVGESARSSEKQAKRGTVPTAPRNPTAATATTAGVLLKWSTPQSNGGTGITGYRIYRSASSGTETLLKSLGNVTNFTDTATVSGVRYYYRITAVNALGEGPPSNEVSAMAR